MAKALECPACGARHSIDSLPDAQTFRCDRCGQVLKVPEAIDALRSASVPSARTGAGEPPPPPPRRGGSAATGPRVSATASATVPVSAAAADGPHGGDRDGATARPAPRRRARWYWRVLAWVVAVPLGLVLTGWPALQFNLLKKDDLLDVFVGSGAGRYTRLIVFAAAWALVTALLVQLFVEGGRWWSARRARARAAAA
ncbi:MAG: hypothetical protein ACHQIG_08620 [Acidimicrobiia bacterium]